MADTVTLPPPSPPLPWWVQPGLAYQLLWGFLGVVFIIVIRSDDKYEQLALMALFGLVTGAIGFYFGSSSSSNKKDDQTTALGAALATSTPVVSALTEPTDTAKELDAKLAAAPAV